VELDEGIILGLGQKRDEEDEVGDNRQAGVGLFGFCCFGHEAPLLFLLV
jgi:hypothetical protein